MTNILIVEDESIVAWDIKETLEKLGHQVVDLVVSGAEAIRAATTSRPDLVLMDIRLAGELDGITAGAQIYDRLNIPVVYLSAHADDRTLDRATQSNPFGYIIKPFRSQTLQSTIQIACQRHQREAAARQSQTDLANTLNSLGSGTIVTDRLGVVTFINSTAQELTGWDAKQAIGQQIGRVFRLHWEADGIAIENPSLRAMRLQQPVKSPARCWLTAQDRSQIPISDTANPIYNSDGEVVGSIVIFYDNTQQIGDELDLQEHNQDLENFQLRLISQLQSKTAEYQQAIACTQLLELILAKVHTVTTEKPIDIALQQLGTTLDADYCWCTLHDVRGTTASIVSEYISTERQTFFTSQVGQQIDVRLYPRFYNQLFEGESWIDPPREIMPKPYLALWDAAAQMLICPTISDPPGAADLTDRIENWAIPGSGFAIGEVGILTTGKPPWTDCQARLLSQILSYAVKLRHRHPESIERESLSSSLAWLDRLKDEFRISLIDVNRAMHVSAEILQEQIRSIDVKTENLVLVEQYQSLHQKLALNLQLLQAEWHRQFQLIDILVRIQTNDHTSKIQSLSDVQFERWIAEIMKRCTTLTQRYRQEISGKITDRLPPELSYPFTVIELIVIELFENACKYTPQQHLISLEVAIDDRQLQFSVVSAGIELSTRELELIFLPFARDAQEFAATSGITGLGLSLVNKLVPLMGYTIQATSDREATRLIFTVPVS
jgi:PAS domain S-box-containing protein